MSSASVPVLALDIPDANVTKENDEIVEQINKGKSPLSEASLDEALLSLCALTDVEAEQEGNKKGSSKFSGVLLKELCVRFALKKSLSKPQMITSIRESSRNKEKLKIIIEDREGGTYRTNCNTLPRLINLVMKFPDAIMRSNALASKEDLQNKEVNGSKPIWITVAEQFNDREHNSGGLVHSIGQLPHEELTSRNIDPEKISPDGVLTSKQAYDLFKFTTRFYANKVLPNFEASGKHNGHDFYSYCNNNTDALYLHEKLKQLGNPELTAFCLEGNVLPGGFDSGINGGDCANTETPIERSSNNKNASIKIQQDMVNVMRERSSNEGASNTASIRRDLNVAMSVLTTSYMSTEKRLSELEVADDAESNPKKKAKIIYYEKLLLKMEEQRQDMEDELLEMKVVKQKVVVVTSNMFETPTGSIPLTIPSPMDENSGTFENV